MQIATRFFPFSAVWTEELTRYLFIFAVSFGAPLAMKRQEFISIDFLLNAIPARFRNYYKAFTQLLVIVMSGYIAYYGYYFMLLGQGQRSATMNIEMSWIHASIGISMLFIGVYAVISIYDLFVSRKRGDQA
jgi:TRAP-type transport system small permease protein